MFSSDKKPYEQQQQQRTRHALNGQDRSSSSRHIRTRFLVEGDASTLLSPLSPLSLSTLSLLSATAKARHPRGFCCLGLTREASFATKRASIKTCKRTDRESRRSQFGLWADKYREREGGRGQHCHSFANGFGGFRYDRRRWRNNKQEEGSNNTCDDGLSVLCVPLPRDSLPYWQLNGPSKRNTFYLYVSHFIAEPSQFPVGGSLSASM